MSEIVLKNLQSAYSIYLIIVGADKLTGSLFGTVQMVYFATEVTSDPFQLVLIWTVFQISVLLFEIPTGVIADIYSRRLSVILGFLATSLGSLVVGAFQTYSLVLLAMAILGVGDALLSDAPDAWIADEIGNERVFAAQFCRRQTARPHGRRCWTKTPPPEVWSSSTLPTS